MKINLEQFNEISSLADKLKDSLSVDVKIDHGEVRRVVVSDLVKKYTGAAERNQVDYMEALKKVLRFYLTDKEIDERLINK